MTRNAGTIDRALRIVLGLVLLLVATNARRAFTHEPVPRTDAFLAVRAG